MERSTTGPIRRILVPSDGSFFAEQALPYAAAIGGRDAELTLLQVVPTATPLHGLLGKRLLTAEQVQHATEAGAREGLEQARESWIPNHPTVGAEVATGDSADEILAAATRHEADLIVMATHGRGTLDRWIIGSVADRVARSSTMPVLLIHPLDEVPAGTGARRIERLIVPLDGSELAAQALPMAARLARQHGIPVRLVTVSDLPRELAIVTAYGAAYSPEVYDELLAEGRAEAEKHLAAAATQLADQGVTVEQQLLDGPVASEIAGVAGEHDVIVMTSHGHGGVRRWFLGSTASKLIHQPKLAVLLIPAGQTADERRA